MVEANKIVVGNQVWHRYQNVVLLYLDIMHRLNFLLFIEIGQVVS